MKTLQQHISEKLVLTNNSKIRKTAEIIEVKTNKELQNIVRDRYLENPKELDLTDLETNKFIETVLETINNKKYNI